MTVYVYAYTHIEAFNHPTIHTNKQIKQFLKTPVPKVVRKIGSLLKDSQDDIRTCMK